MVQKFSLSTDVDISSCCEESYLFPSTVRCTVSSKLSVNQHVTSDLTCNRRVRHAINRLIVDGCQCDMHISRCYGVIPGWFDNLILRLNQAKLPQKVIGQRPNHETHESCISHASVLSVLCSSCISNAISAISRHLCCRQSIVRTLAGCTLTVYLEP